MAEPNVEGGSNMSEDAIVRELKTLWTKFDKFTESQADDMRELRDLIANNATEISNIKVEQKTYKWAAGLAIKSASLATAAVSAIAAIWNYI